MKIWLWYLHKMLSYSMCKAFGCCWQIDKRWCFSIIICACWTILFGLGADNVWNIIHRIAPKWIFILTLLEGLLGQSFETQIEELLSFTFTLNEYGQNRLVNFNNKYYLLPKSCTWWMFMRLHITNRSEIFVNTQLSKRNI